ncbi:MAG: type IX secretion system outer membrane channel protein PorV [Bacteroidetes bacterium]|nr:type IX secretion system outer membrane channel protein PorV [Bacteroidota bacterium]
MKHQKITGIVLLLSMCSGLNLLAQSNKISTDELSGKVNTVTTAVPFLMIGPDSRAGAMGDAGVATSPDANSIHWNPSKLAFVDKKMGLSLSYTPWLRNLVGDINLAYLAGYYKVGKDATLAASLKYFSLGDITFTDIVGETIGNFKPHESAFDLAYARKLSDNFSGGLAIRYISSDLTNGITLASGGSTKVGRTVAADISGYYNNDKIKIGEKKGVVNVGLNISNIGGKISYTETAQRDFIPINMRLGAGLKIIADEYNTIAFTVEAGKLLTPTAPLYAYDSTGAYIYDSDGNKTIEKGQDPNRPIVSGMLGSFNDAPGGGKEELKEVTLAGGLEYWYDNLLAIRAGYFNEAATKGNRKYFTLGVGVKYSAFGLDFSYLIPTVQNNPLQNTLRFTLLFNFDKKAVKDVPTEESN